MKKLILLFGSIILVVCMGAISVCAQNVNSDEHSITIKTDFTIKSRESVEFPFTVFESGEYEIVFKYKALENKTNAMKISVGIDGKAIHTEKAGITLPRFWTNKSVYRMDSNGNQFAPEQLLCEDIVNYTLLDTSNYAVNPFKINLNNGEHKIFVNNMENTSFYLESIVLEKIKEVKKYDDSTLDYKNYEGDDIYAEGEDAKLKSSYWLSNSSDNGSALVTPSDAVKTKINYVGGANWSESGETITWDVEAPEEGLYVLSFSYKQSFILNGNVYRWLRLNGETQFAEAEMIEFPYNINWETMDYKDDGGESYKVHLKKGKNEISLTATLGCYTDICKDLNDVLEQIGNLYLDISMVTGETVDIYRDYRLFEQVPDFENRLSKINEKLNDVDKKIIELTDGEIGSYSTAVRNMQNVIKLMLDNRYIAHRYKSNFDSNYSALNSCLNDMGSTPLSIDRIIISAPDKETVTENGFMILMKKIVFSFKKFVASFTEDYNQISSSGNNDDKVTVWVNWGRDQAQILNMLIQSDFTSKYNIAVDVKISNATVVQGVVSGNGPDVLLHRSRTEPVNLAMRDVLYDLREFEDLEDVLERFNKGAEIPYIYNEGLYALPDTQTFFMMFYRTDVFEKLGMDYPKTWDEYKQVIRLLSKNNLDAWLPYTQLTDMNIANTGVGSLNIFPTMLLQNGIELYNKDFTKTTLTETNTISVFSDWTSYYTKLKLSYQLDFYNRFRNGTCPIGIAPYTTYSTLKDAAKEIDGKWLMKNVPGVVQDDGTINNSTAGGGTGCVILKNAQNPEAAWEFIKWWTDADTQLAYSNNLESVLGTIGRVAISNKEAFENMSWDCEMYDDINSAFNNIKEIREIPGSYYISRSIDFAFWEVANKNKTAKDMLITWGEEADAEIERKLAEYEK